MPLFYVVPVQPSTIRETCGWLLRRKLAILPMQADRYIVKVPYWKSEKTCFFALYKQKHIEQQLCALAKEKQGKFVMAECLKTQFPHTQIWHIQPNLTLPLVREMVEFYFQSGNIQPQQVDIHFVCQNVCIEAVEIIKQLAQLYRSVHIVSPNRVPYTKLADKLYAEKAQLVTVSNHKRNALKQAQWIINYDMPIEVLSTYTINRNSTLFLLQNRMQKMPIGFCQMVVQDILIEGNEKWEQYIQDIPLQPDAFSIKDLVASVVYTNHTIQEQQQRLQAFGIHIKGLCGINGMLTQQELQKTCRETIDKTRKLH